VLAKDIQHPRAHLGEVHSVNVGDAEGLSVEADVNVGSVTRALLSAGTDLVDIGQISIGGGSTEAENKFGQRSTEALGEGHVGSGVGFGDSSLFCGLELVRDLGHCGNNLVETRCIDSRNMTEDSSSSTACPSPECEVGDGRLGSINAHVMVWTIDSSSRFPEIDNGLVADWVGGVQGQNNLGPEPLEGHAAVRLGNKGRGKVLRQGNDSARSDALAGGVVGNGRNVVNTSAKGGVGRMVSVGVMVTLTASAFDKRPKASSGTTNGTTPSSEFPKNMTTLSSATLWMPAMPR